MNDEFEKLRMEIATGLAEFFRAEPHKIALWLLTPNPHFGGMAPGDVIAILDLRGLEKVANFVRERDEMP